MDVVDFETPHEKVVDTVADLDAVRRAVEGCEGIVIAHMASRQAGSYETPVVPFDVNVKGTANLYHAMMEREMKRAVLISTRGVLLPEPKADAVPGEGPYHFEGTYVMTKIMQEVTARRYHDEFGIATTIFRPAWIVYDGKKVVTKYGEEVDVYRSSFMDPRDIGRAVLMALDLEDPKLEAFSLGQDDSDAHLEPIRKRLGWYPRHTFDGLPRPPEGE
jgi:nucleoside-diphosphate-sugar epimerase